MWNMRTGTDREFNSEEPPKGHDKRMQNRLDEAFGKKQNPWSVWYKIAAVVVMGLLAIWYFSAEQNSSMQTTAEKEPLQQKEQFPMEQAEHYYKQSFQTQFKLLAKQNSSPQSKAMINSSKEMIAELDEQYLELEKELSKTGDQRVAAAMITNYKQRIEILETLIQKINYVNHLKQTKDENIAT
jgi:hypothetical protein